jgi:hypothetical protein
MGRRHCGSLLALNVVGACCTQWGASKTPLILNLRHYHEFNAERRFEGNETIASGTVRF